MVKILVLGSTGMLGNEVTKYFLGSNKYEVITTYRDESLKFPGNSVSFDVLNDPLDKLPINIDYVINCIGIIKPFMKDNKLNAIKINSVFPNELGKWCNNHDINLIHITTDCVYSGNKGEYVESDLHDALDDYGKSKSLGECTNEAMVLRTSIIGEEIHKNASLISWAKSQKGKEVDGYITHLWNGITTREFAKVCDKLIQNNWYEKGIFHIFAKDDVTKYDMLKHFNEKYKLNLIINKATPEKIDRTLRTEKQLCEKLEIPTVYEMIREM